MEMFLEAAPYLTNTSFSHTILFEKEEEEEEDGSEEEEDKTDHSSSNTDKEEAEGSGESEERQIYDEVEGDEGSEVGQDRRGKSDDSGDHDVRGDPTTNASVILVRSTTLLMSIRDIQITRPLCIRLINDNSDSSNSFSSTILPELVYRIYEEVRWSLLSLSISQLIQSMPHISLSLTHSLSLSLSLFRVIYLDV
jgi:hypothetical protein